MLTVHIALESLAHIDIAPNFAFLMLSFFLHLLLCLLSLLNLLHLGLSDDLPHDLLIFGILVQSPLLDHVVSPLHILVSQVFEDCFGPFLDNESAHRLQGVAVHLYVLQIVVLPDQVGQLHDIVVRQNKHRQIFQVVNQSSWAVHQFVLPHVEGGQVGESGPAQFFEVFDSVHVEVQVRQGWHVL